MAKKGLAVQKGKNDFKTTLKIENPRLFLAKNR